MTVSPRKKIVILMNCHAQEVMAYLWSNEAIRREYEIIPYETYTAEEAEHKNAIHAAIKAADILLTQNVKSIEWLRNDHIATLIKPGCIFIRLAFWRFNGYWPLHQSAHASAFNYLPIEVGNISNFEEYINFCIPPAVTTEHFESELLKLSEVDAGSDIRMMPFFLGSYKDFNLLSDAWHPTSYFFFDLTKRIMSQIGFEPNIRLRPNSLINNNRYRLIFNNVASTLGLNYDFSYLRFFAHTIHRETFFEFSRFMVDYPNTDNMKALPLLFYTWVGQERLTVRPVDMAALGSHSSGLSSTAKMTDISSRTDAERLNFWQVDLREIREIAEIVIWNRGRDDRLSSVASTTLVVSISVDDLDWHTIQTTSFALGSSNGTSPLRIALGAETMVRYIKLEANGSMNFHVDKIEAFSPVLA